MSSLFKNLADEDLRIENDLKKLERQMDPPQLGLGYKVFIVGGFVLALASAVGSGYLYQSINHEKRQRQALETSQTQIQEKASILEQNSFKDRSQIEKLQQEVKRYEAVRLELARQIDTNQKQLDEFRVKLKDVEEKTSAMAKAAEEAQGEVELKAEGPEISGASSSAVSSQGTSGSVTPSKTESAASQAAKQNFPLLAKNQQVLTVNRKFNFVVVNLGLRDNAKLGDNLSVIRSGKPIGKVTIEKIYDNFSAATILEEPQKDPIKEGDIISKA